MSFTIYHDLMIEADASKVYEAIVQPHHLENWWPLRASGEPQVGKPYNYHFSEEHDWYGRVIEVIPNQLFRLEMTDTDPDWLGTILHFEVQEKEKGVNLRFAHEQWREVNGHYRRTSYIWAMLLKGFKQYVEQGIILPFLERE